MSDSDAAATKYSGDDGNTPLRWQLQGHAEIVLSHSTTLMSINRTVEVLKNCTYTHIAEQGSGNCDYSHRQWRISGYEKIVMETLH